MKKNIHEVLFSSLAGRVGSLFVSVYALFWTAVEPLSLSWIDNHRVYWRVGLLIASILVTIILLIPFASRYLIKIEIGASDMDLRDACVSTGKPILAEMVDGQLGAVMIIRADYTADPLDWHVPVSAQKAGRVEFIYKYTKVPFHFYVRVVVTSSDGSATATKWIRFDHNVAIPDRYNKQEEMACPYSSLQKNGYQTTAIDLNSAVKNTFGQGGWQYQRIILFRVRGEGFIKHIGFKRKRIAFKR
jgi:hypothetical protein